MLVFKVVCFGFDFFYFLVGVFVVFCLIVILVLIVLQMLVCWIGEVVFGIFEYVGYFMVVVLFFVFVNVFNWGSYIWVLIFFNVVFKVVVCWIDVWCFVIGLLVMWYFVWFGWCFVNFFILINDISQGQDCMLLWILQFFMLVGVVIMVIVLIDYFIYLLFDGKYWIKCDLVDQSFGE